jgi:NCAIR mutase (PurE)-related protein
VIKNLLESYKNGEIDLEEAEEKIMKILYEQGEDFFLDMHRHRRTGFPEVILMEGKSTEQMLEIVRNFLVVNGCAFVSNRDEEKENALRNAFSGVKIKKAGRLMVIGQSDKPGEKFGMVGIITAGTADVPYARECELLLKETGAEVVEAFDLGVSGLHRPFFGIRKTKDTDVLIIFAGMDGILPTMIASLTQKPVIAVPTPIGYGFGGRGEAALRTMLQSCVPGVVVMNIGNSIGAAAAALRILKAIKRQEDVPDGET